jgi:hypothetical protein
MSTAIRARVSTERQTLTQTIEQQVERLSAHVYAQRTSPLSLAAEGDVRAEVPFSLFMP